MRHQATALLIGDEKQVLVDLAASHQDTQSTILRAALLEFAGSPESQEAWIGMANQLQNQEATDCPLTQHKQ